MASKGAETLLDHTDEPTQALERAVDPFVAMVERLATSPQVDVLKLEKLLDMQERILQRNAEIAFNTAFVEMQAELPVIQERKKTNNGKYAPLEDIVSVVRPILHKHGFSLSHATQWPDKGVLKIVGILTHKDGHARRSEFQTEADESGNKNDIQGLGSAMTYGRRYTTHDLLCITTRDEDTDGHGRTPNAPAPPEGYPDWLDDMRSVSLEGEERLKAAWKESKIAFRNYVSAHAPTVWTQIKAAALQADKAKS